MHQMATSKKYGRRDRSEMMRDLKKRTERNEGRIDKKGRYAAPLQKVEDKKDSFWDESEEKNLTNTKSKQE
jgi:hypothetical protein